jgi:hypothetical protein
MSVNNMVTGRDFFRAMSVYFDIPEHAKSITIHADMEDLVTITTEFYPEKKQDGDILLKKYLDRK